MTTAIIGTGGIGSIIARQLASGGETVRLSSADNKSARMPAAEIGRAAVVAVDNRDALRSADAVVLALRFGVLTAVKDEIAARQLAGFETVKVGGIQQSGRLEVGGDLRGLVVGPAEARSMIGGA
jgi:predicted dinucleotide-binding enzyme